MHTRQHCIAADRADPLARFKDEFILPPGVLYLDGNSLGALPRTASARAQAVVESEWGQGLIRSWNSAGWFEMSTRLGDKLAPLLGAGAGEVVVTDTTSVNLFKALAVALRIQQARAPTRRVIVSERDNFPSDLYMVEGLADLLQQGYCLRLVDEALPLAQALDDSVALLVLSHVNYRSGALHDMAALTAQAHDLEMDWRRLQLDRAELTRNARTNRIARQQLGLRPIDAKRTLYVEVPQAEDPTGSIPTRPRPIEPDQRGTR